jgi:hypothetical protein
MHHEGWHKASQDAQHIGDPTQPHQDQDAIRAMPVGLHLDTQI